MLSNPYFQNVVSEYIALGLLIVVAWIVVRATGRRRLLRFFAIKSDRRLVIYLSNLNIRAGGATGVDGAPRSFAEAAVPAYEVELIRPFQRLFNFVVPGVESLPGPLKWLLMSDVSVEVVPSPAQTDEVERVSTLIAIGSPGYNAASSRIEDGLHSLGRFTADNAAVEVDGAPPLVDHTYAFVQRVVDPATGQTVFYVAGPASVGTAGAAHFLVTRWSELGKKYPGTTRFCIMLRVSAANPRQHEIVFERG